jgi:glycosyltransferase involved in cell wall biosynthesis
MEGEENIGANSFNVSCLFLHTLDGSLGSFARVRELSASCAKHGVCTEILTPYEHDRVLSPGVTIHSIPNLALKMGASSQIYGFSRKLYYNKYFQVLGKSARDFALDGFSDKLLKVLRTNATQILQAEQDFSLPACRKVKKFMGIPILADIHNITAEELVAAGVLERDGKEFRDLQHDTAENLSIADVVVVVSDLMKSYVEKEYHLPDSKVVVVPPGGRPRVKQIVRSPEHKFVFSGLASYRENVELFVRSMPHVVRQCSDAKFFLTRKGEMIKQLEKLATQSNVTLGFFWHDNIDDLYSFLSSCYAGILPSSNDLARRMGTPVKLFDYMSVGLPIVANDIGGWTKIISKHKIGILTDSEPERFADGIIKFINDYREEYAENALQLVTKEYNWDNSAIILLDTYNRLVN